MPVVPVVATSRRTRTHGRLDGRLAIAKCPHMRDGWHRGGAYFETNEGAAAAKARERVSPLRVPRATGQQVSASPRADQHRRREMRRAKAQPGEEAVPTSHVARDAS